jgi:signal transduction histidine kinase/CheY-like chemotaxis protein
LKKKYSVKAQYIVIFLVERGDIMCINFNLSNHHNLHGMSHGDHTCLIYNKFEDYAIVATEYIKNGLNANEIVFCVIDEYDEETLINDLKKLDIDVDYFIEKGQLILSSIKNTYRGTREFKPEDTLGFWKSFVEANKDCVGIRILGEATFALDGKYETLERLIEYEIRVNIDLIPLYRNHQYLCVYNKNLYPSAVIKSIIHAHPNYINELLLVKPNPFYLEPNNYLMVHREGVKIYNELQLLDNKVSINLEKELRTDQARFRYILGSIGDGVWDYDIIKDSLYISQSLLVDEDKEETVVNYLQDFLNYIHPDDIKKFKESINLHSQNKTELINEELRLKDINNTWHWYQCKGKTVGKSENGQNTRIVGTFQDIQMRKSIELEKQKLLEHMQRIDKLNSLSILAGGIAHDFNNLLGGIFGYVELAKSISDENDGAVKYLDKALTVFERAKDLTQQLLTFSKGDIPKRETGRLGKFIEDSVLFVLSGTNISCQFDITNDLWLCDFDGNQIGQVIDNLLINSTQAMPQGGKVEISAKNIVIGDGEKLSIEKGKYIEIVIKDYGEGIKKEVIKSIFDPFFSTKPEGNGLGLATCYSIVKKHDGYIEVESEVGKGTTFYIYLPASMGQEVLNEQVALSEHQGEGTILIMDDEEFIRDILSKMLESMGYTVIEAADGDAMLNLSEGLREEGKHIKCTIFDLTVPGGMGGKETRAKFSEIFPDVPVFASSGFSEDPIMAKPRDFGFTDSINKPFRLKEIAQILEKHMDVTG